MVMANPKMVEVIDEREQKNLSDGGETLVCRGGGRKLYRLYIEPIGAGFHEFYTSGSDFISFFSSIWRRLHEIEKVL
jgi:hypothetical protein